MNMHGLVRGALVFAALPLGLAACGASSEGESGLSTSGEALASPADAVAFCEASGLNVIIGTQRNDVVNGTDGADCIVGLGGQDTTTATTCFRADKAKIACSATPATTA